MKDKINSYSEYLKQFKRQGAKEIDVDINAQYLPELPKDKQKNKKNK